MVAVARVVGAVERDMRRRRDDGEDPASGALVDVPEVGDGVVSLARQRGIKVITDPSSLPPETTQWTWGCSSRVWPQVSLYFMPY